MPSRRTVLSIAFSATVAAACRTEPASTGALREIGVTYTLPRGWTQEDSEDKRAVFMFGPVINGNAEASMMLELPVVRDVRAIPEALHLRSEQLRAKYPDYVEHRFDPDVRQGQLSFGLLEYTATKNRVSLTEQHILIRLGSDRTMRLFTTVIADAVQDYRPLLFAFTGSIRIASK